MSVADHAPRLAERAEQRMWFERIPTRWWVAGRGISGAIGCRNRGRSSPGRGGRWWSAGRRRIRAQREGKGQLTVQLRSPLPGRPGMRLRWLADADGTGRLGPSVRPLALRDRLAGLLIGFAQEGRPGASGAEQEDRLPDAWLDGREHRPHRQAAVTTELGAIDAFGPEGPLKQLGEGPRIDWCRTRVQPCRFGRSDPFQGCSGDDGLESLVGCAELDG